MNKNSKKLTIFAGIAAFFVSVVTTPNVVAQDTESQSGANIIEEITVTVRKREESLQDVPISITAYNEAMLTNKGVKRLRDLEFSVPNMTFTEQGNAFGGFGIRGIYTLVRSIGVESGVSVYVDGVYQGRNSNANIDVIDVERIEVLKGPQGTLFGRNTISGAVNIVIKQPGDEFEGKINASYGNLDRIGANISLSGPIMEDKLYARFAVSHYERDGFTENLFNGQDLDNEDRQSGRLNLRYLPDDDLEINFSLDGFRDRGDTPRGGYLVTNTPGRFWRVDTEFAQLSDPRVTSLDNSPSNNIGIFEERDIWGTSVSADYRFSNDYTLTSITAYREGNFETASDFDGTGAEVAGGTTGSDSNQFTQELRINSPGGMTFSSLPGEFDFVAGFFYLYQDTTAFLLGTIGGGCIQSTCPRSSLPGPATFGPQSSVKTDSWALYLNANWYLTEKLTFTAGLRYTSEDKELDFQQDPALAIGIIAVSPLSLETGDDDISPTFSIAYQIMDDVTAYSTISRGFKSAGFNADVVGNTNLEFNSETVTSFEVGFKSLLFNRRVKLNGAFFFQDYEDLQVQQFIGAVQQVSNAAQAEITGLEIELDARITEFVDFSLGVGYVDAEFKDFPDANRAGDNYAGNKLQAAPELTANAALQYANSINGTTEFLVRGEWTYRGEQFFQADNAPFTRQGGYSLFNARAALRFMDGKYELALFADNISDKVYGTNRLGFLGTELGHWGAPRTYGAEVSIDF